MSAEIIDEPPVAPDVSASNDPEVSEVGCSTLAGVVPRELEAIGRENSAALEELLKKIDG